MAIKISGIIDFDELQQRLELETVLLIDVRNRTEIASLGKIPNSFNVPMPEILAGAFELPKIEFKKKYKFDMPDKNEEFVLTCRSGRRASAAGEYLKGLGYSKSRVYLGSFNDWVSKGGTVIKDNKVSI